jgi:hypothetical protein
MEVEASVGEHLPSELSHARYHSLDFSHARIQVRYSSHVLRGQAADSRESPPDRAAFAFS